MSRGDLDVSARLHTRGSSGKQRSRACIAISDAMYDPRHIIGTAGIASQLFVVSQTPGDRIHHHFRHSSALAYSTFDQPSPILTLKSDSPFAPLHATDADPRACSPAD